MGEDLKKIMEEYYCKRVCKPFEKKSCESTLTDSSKDKNICKFINKNI